ncbi:sulfite exporter TauE/SafE family protein [Oricola sp.]|uniref:sulfite exporter TauE/SafE family protein n=1 Tax=Oricola sp. TaxID=1979950 RepID=UPI0025D7931A|nr:sulfite exporter TauE/SafE family protein [Oricola sp.]MCI5074616.1 sulfite exporter TauE/SafE family protein [Oricola sp.]
MTVFGIPLDAAFITLLAAIAVAGVVRGFSGFGSGMIVGPVGAMTFGPQVAIVVLLVIDTLPMVPLIVSSARKVSMRELLPVVAGYGLLVPIGIWILKTGDTTMLRWSMSTVILIAAVLLWSGWCYRGPRNVAVRLGVGGMSGFLGGACAVAGPPVILYWMALSTGAGLVRANLLIYFAITQLLSGTGLLVAGILTKQSILLGALCTPAYLAGLLVGARLFGFASDKAYRRVALTIVIAAAILTLPALDALRG